MLSVYKLYLIESDITMYLCMENFSDTPAELTTVYV
jgi:hypothetical protein